MSKSQKHRAKNKQPKPQNTEQHIRRPRKLTSVKLPKNVETGAPTLIDMNCTHCGGALELTDDTHAKCPFCGASYLIDKPEDLNVNIYLPDHSKFWKKLKDFFDSIKEPLFFAMLKAAAVILLLCILAIAQGIIGYFKEKNYVNPALQAFYEDVLGEKYRKLSERDFERIKYLKVVGWTSSRDSGECRIQYSFTDYADCESEEAFEATVQEWTGTFGNVDARLDFDKLKGLTYVVADGQSYVTYPQDAQLTRVDTRSLEDVSRLCGDNAHQKKKIRVLNLSRHDSVTLEEFAQYPNLRELDLKIDHIASEVVVNLDVFASCPELERLSVECTAPCVGLSGLGKLKNLRTLKLSNATVAQCGFLKELPQLENLTLLAGKTDSLENLQGLTQLKSLCLRKESICLSKLPAFSNLEELQCSVDSQTEFDQLARFPTLKRCEISVDDEVDLRVLEQMENLESLQLNALFLRQVHHLECALNLKKLETLRIWGVSVLSGRIYLDTELVAPNDTLKELCLKGCEFCEENGAEPTLAALGRLQALENLTLYKCGITQIGPLGTLPNLRELNLEKNEIYDYSPLANCPKLKKVYLGGNPIIDPELPAEVEVISYLTNDR